MKEFMKKNSVAVILTALMIVLAIAYGIRAGAGLFVQAPTAPVVTVPETPAWASASVWGGMLYNILGILPGVRKLLKMALPMVLLILLLRLVLTVFLIICLIRYLLVPLVRVLGGGKWEPLGGWRLFGWLKPVLDSEPQFETENPNAKTISSRVGTDVHVTHKASERVGKKQENKKE